MKKFLVVLFDRYETTQSVNKFVEAEDFKEAALESGWYEEPEEGEGEGYDDWTFKQVNETFACVPGEEQDILIYLIP